MAGSNRATTASLRRRSHRSRRGTGRRHLAADGHQESRCRFPSLAPHTRLVQEEDPVSSKVPGWGITPAARILERRDGRRGPEVFLDHPDHEAPFWVGLYELGRFRGRVIYAPVTSCNPTP